MSKYRVRHRRPVSREPRKHFGSVKPVLVNLYLKTERCIKGTSVHITNV